MRSIISGRQPREKSTSLCTNPAYPLKAGEHAIGARLRFEIFVLFSDKQLTEKPEYQGKNMVTALVSANPLHNFVLFIQLKICLTKQKIQMKKGLLICLAFGISMSVIAQQSVRLAPGFRTGAIPAAVKNRSIQVPKKIASESGVPVNNLQSRRYTQPTHNQISSTYLQEEVIGYTFYDLQTNGAISNRLVHSSDGSFSAAWTFSPNADQAPVIFPDRGTATNYYDPNPPSGFTNWNTTPTGIDGDYPNTRIEPSRTGFTNIVTTESGAEVTIQHTGTEMSMNRRPVKGTGAWTFTKPFGTANNDFWPKAVAGGASGESIHAIWSGSDGTASHFGQIGPLFYSRSDDGGQTWVKNKTILAEIDSTQYLGFTADAYSIEAKGDVVVICFGDIDTDLGILKSTDNGNTWTKTIVMTFPIPMFDSRTMISDVDADGIADTIVTNGGDPSILIDNNNMVHVWFSANRVLCTTPGTGTGQGLSYFPGTDGLFYWNETMPTDGFALIAQSWDYNGDGEIGLPLDATCDWPMGLYGGGLTGMPSAAQDPTSGTIYCTYQAICEECDTALYFQAHHHVYMITSSDMGVSWTQPFDLVPDTLSGGNGEFQEAVFGSVCKFVDNNVYVLYQRDLFPGLALASSGCDQANNLGNTSDEVFVKVEAATVGISNLPNSSAKDFSVSQNYPNPANGSTSINISINKSSDISINVTDLIGKTVYSEIRANSAAGTHTVTFNTQHWNAGVYFYTVNANGQKVTRQLVVE